MGSRIKAVKQKAYSGFKDGVALVNALVLGKFALITRALHLGDTAEDAPLIYPTLLKSALFSIVLSCFKILEKAAVGFDHERASSDSIAELGEAP